MTQIKSHAATINTQSPEYQAALREIAGEVAIELDSLVDKMSDFLEMRLTAEIDELKEDIDDALMLRAVNDALMKENVAFRDQITALTIENMRLSAAPHVSVMNGTLFTSLTGDQIKTITDYHDDRKKHNIGGHLSKAVQAWNNKHKFNRFLVVGENGLELVMPLKDKA